MKKSDALFQLIKSLSRGEKRSFRMLAQLTSGDKKYLQLFDAIDKQNDYDEEKLLKSFRKDPGFIKQFAYNKNYLYNSILNSLSYFYKGQEGEISTLSVQVKILMEKNLFSHAKKLVRKVKEKHQSLERMEDLLKALQLEILVIRNTENIKLFHDACREIEFEERLAMEKLRNLQEYRMLENELMHLVKTVQIARHSDELERIEKIRKSRLLSAETEALTIRGKILFNEIQRKLSFYEGDFDEAVSYAERAMRLYEKSPGILEAEKCDYIKQVIKYGILLFKLKGLDDAIPVVRQLNALEVSTPFERLTRFNGLIFELSMRIDCGRKAGADELILKIEEELSFLGNDLGEITRMDTLFYVSCYYVLAGDHSAALSWLNQFLNHPRTNTRTDMQCAARILSLVIQFELGHFDVMEYSVKSASRFIYKQERMYEYERTVLKYIRALTNLASDQERREKLIEMQDAIEEVVKDPFEKRALNLFDILHWIEGKLTGKTGLEITEMKYLESRKMVVKK